MSLSSKWLKSLDCRSHGEVMEQAMNPIRLELNYDIANIEIEVNN